MKTLQLNRNIGRSKPMWKYTAACRAMNRTGKAGGIDSIRYRCEVLRPKLIPPAKQCGLEDIV